VFDLHSRAVQLDLPVGDQHRAAVSHSAPPSLTGVQPPLDCTLSELMTANATSASPGKY
jgi:hypothetical protein